MPSSPQSASEMQVRAQSPGNRCALGRRRTHFPPGHSVANRQAAPYATASVRALVTGSRPSIFSHEARTAHAPSTAAHRQAFTSRR